MCVAVLVETKKGPTDAELWAMDDANPHGAGVAWASGELIRYKKGLTWQQVRDLLPTIPRPCLLHFRWATHGGRARYLSHPFPIGPRAVTSRKLNSAAKSVLIHNGVWSDYLKYAPHGVNLDKWSDTAIAAYAAGVLGEEILEHVAWSTAVGTAVGGGRMDVTLRGDWEEYAGNMYSNTYWHYRSRSRMIGRYFSGDGGEYNTGTDSLRGYMGGWEGYTPDDMTPVKPAYGTALGRGYGVQPSHSAYDLPPMGLESLPFVDITDVEDIPALTANLREPRWRADGKLIRIGEPLVCDLPAEEPIDTWLTEEYAATQRALEAEFATLARKSTEDE